MDTALYSDRQVALKQVLATHMEAEGVQYQALRTRQAGARQFISFHVLVPGEWTVHRGHQRMERIEADIRRALPAATILTHLESVNDPSSWNDVNLDRTDQSPKV